MAGITLLVAGVIASNIAAGRKSRMGPADDDKSESHPHTHHGDKSDTHHADNTELVPHTSEHVPHT
jgi:hypothetical protein